MVIPIGANTNTPCKKYCNNLADVLLNIFIVPDLN
jgi:hypothetical protein